MRTFPIYKKKIFGRNCTINRKFLASKDPVIWIFPTLIGAQSWVEASAWSSPNPLRGWGEGVGWGGVGWGRGVRGGVGTPSTIYLLTIESVWLIWVSCPYALHKIQISAARQNVTKPRSNHAMHVIIFRISRILLLINYNAGAITLTMFRWFTSM